MRRRGEGGRAGIKKVKDVTPTGGVLLSLPEISFDKEKVRREENHKQREQSQKHWAK